LVGKKDEIKCIQTSVALEGLSIISCGNIPPNPSELLSSNRMNAAIESFKKMFDYIIIDLPPISAVTDALIVSNLTDGIVIVTRQDYADKRLVDDAVRQLQFHEANIIGFVMNCTHTENKYYGKYKKYGRYGRYYRYGKYYQYGRYGHYSKNNTETET